MNISNWQQGTRGLLCFGSEERREAFQKAARSFPNETDFDFLLEVCGIDSKTLVIKPYLGEVPVDCVEIIWRNVGFGDDYADFIVVSNEIELNLN